MTGAATLLVVLRQPERLALLSPPEQEFLLRLARRVGMLGPLHHGLERAGLLATLPAPIRDGLEGGRVVADSRERSILWEVDRLERAFFGTRLPVILLKGAAYAALGLPLARGRLMADIDILLPRADLPLAERELRKHGWLTATTDPYDQHYYREWMHELPPMRHCHRPTELDIHHAILPRTGRLQPDSALLLQEAIPLPGRPEVWTLAPVDMVLHAVVQLFHDSDFGANALRDLLDLDGLLRHYGPTPGFGDRLWARSRALHLTAPLHAALYFLQRFCQTPVPEHARPGWLMRGLITLAMLPDHPDPRRDGMPVRLARWCLYVRSHWLRMPPGLLLTHLTRKGLRRWRQHVWHRRGV
ncbi:MAG: nucleotidyltransferase family protein [Magnetococcales bacterium]|nr:nucleotidyltransferase family protein [Magnetococcales bacterium]